MVTKAFLSKVYMAEERMSVDEEVSSVSLEEAAGTAPNSVETVASSNTSLNHSNVGKDLFSQIARNCLEQRIMVASHFSLWSISIITVQKGF